MSDEQISPALAGQVDRQVRPWWQNSLVLRVLFPPALQPGDVMLFDDKSANPFKNPPHRVVVKATLGDWINYRWESGAMWQNESMRRRAFAACYMKA